MDNDKLAIVILLAIIIIPVSLYLTRDGFHGYDSYYYYTQVCNPENNHYQDNSVPLEKFIFSVLPCNENALKLILWALLVLSFIPLYLIGELVYKGAGIYTIIFSFISPALLFKAFQFENDIFSYPLLFFSLYFFLKYTKTRSIIDAILSIGFLGIATNIWGGSIYYLFGFVFMEPVFLVVLIPLIFIFKEPLFAGIMFNPLVQENNFSWGLLFFYLYVMNWKTESKKDLQFPFLLLTAFFTLFGLVNPKFFILAVPFLSLTIVKNYWEAIESQKSKLLGWAIGALLIFSFVLSANPIYQIPPAEFEKTAVKELIEITEQEYTIQDWSLGHMVWFYGGKTGNHSGPGMGCCEQENLGYDGYVLSRHDLDCTIEKQYDNPILGNALRLYDC